jgi:2-polyprenyl-3-methyl-5-hydroxy-6-metoxy-1,4-benzoquinol methylase
VPVLEQETAHLQRWRSLWGEAYGQAAPPRDPSLNVAGWASSYTGKAIREGEMKEWVERTVERLHGLAPVRVLEIGCGTGMLLLRMAPRCAEYVGVDFSAEALSYVRSCLDAEGLRNVTLVQSTADDLSGIGGGFDLIVLNSVVQYFPSLDYLLRVLAGAVEKSAPGGRVFLGDLRSLPLLEAFHTSVQLQQADEAMTVDELRERVGTAVRQERELVLHPALFASMPEVLPGVGRVEIQLKRGRARNEMTRFRYDAILHLSDAIPEPSGPPARWLEWGDPDSAPSKLRQLLVSEAPAAVGVRHVPNARLAAEMEARGLLRAPGSLRTVGELQEALRRTRPAGFEPEDFWALEKDLPYRVRIGWSEGAGDGSYDVHLRHRESGAGEPVVGHKIDSMLWANSPLGEGGQS